MSDAARRVRAFLMTLSEEDRAWLADELAASLSATIVSPDSSSSVDETSMQQPAIVVEDSKVQRREE